MSSNKIDEILVLLTAFSLVNDDLKMDDIPSQQTISRLRQLPTPSLMKVVGESMSLDLHIDVQKANVVMNRVELQEQERQNFVWAIENGASNKMLTNLFPALFESTLVASIRGSKFGFNRKPTIKNEAANAKIFNEWRVAMTKHEGLFERLKYVHGALNGEYDLQGIYHAVTEFEEI
ncbi:STY4526/YPO1902 family pathogenicity island replication protein [Hydromonas duriensis]|uniref:Uncharacterized protein DUF2857 n=1 Tax=Hydromonas duriensis TaxID=1527608 RepID=A0A4R6XZU6_9BURK|nr:STY4526/YPO1902 family pathogenicity island replication protein [Hydromonas duriensis]TDR27707.1 uncharacterized protein DUF2857 [Hydromonas duriensis]